MLDRFREFVREHRLLQPGDRVLAAYSGGADSTCLLHLLTRAGFKVVGAHLHHGQRPEAEEDLEHCSRFAEAIGADFVTGRADVPKLAADLKIGLEEAGREARYAFFEESAIQAGCNVIATGHTKSDHVETVLLNLVRGTGLAGLGGIPVRRKEIIRPLLFAIREETETYCREEGLAFRHDSTNRDLSFSRPRIRELVMPELRKINRSVEEAIARLAMHAREEDEFLDGAAAAALERLEIPLNGPLRFLTIDSEVAIDRKHLGHLPPVLLRRALRLLASTLGGSLDAHVCRTLADSLLTDDKGSMTTEKGAVVFTWNSERLHVAVQAQVEGFKLPQPVPGEQISATHGWRLRTAVAPTMKKVFPRDALRVQIDVDGFRGPIHLRSLQPGDRVRPLGGVGHRKIADMMSEAGLTALAKVRLPILCDIIGPIWVPGVVLDERVRPAPGSPQALEVEFGSISDKSDISETLARADTYANS